jgi:hypothetical protein
MKRDLLIIGMLVLSVPCLAITPTATPPAPRSDTPQKWANPQTAKATRDDSSGLRKGTIEGVSVGGGTFHVYGQRLTFDTKHVKVYGRDGKPTSIYALRKGATIRFTLDATDPIHRRVAVIYLD